MPKTAVLLTHTVAPAHAQTLVITDPFILQQVLDHERAGAVEKPLATIGAKKNAEVGC